MIHWYCRIAQRQGAVRPGMKASWNILSFFLPYGTSRRDSLSWVYGSNTGCNAGIFIYRFSSAGRAPVSKTGSAGSSPASGANLPGRPEKLTYMIFFFCPERCRVGIFISFFREALSYAKSLSILWANPRQEDRLRQAPNLWTISATGCLPQHAGVAAQARMDPRTRYAPVSLVLDLRQAQLCKSISTPH